MVSLDVVVLCKNNKQQLLSTLQSIPISESKLSISTLIIDGSEDPIIAQFSANEAYVLSQLNYRFYYLPPLGVAGIYPSMNYALSRLLSDWVVFMNSGDTFHSTLRSEDISHLLSTAKAMNKIAVFGVANVTTSDGSLSWSLPSTRLSKVNTWLRFFEPIHQSIFVQSSIARLYPFDTSSYLYADALWKRKILKPNSTLFTSRYICNFVLGGASSSYDLPTLITKMREPSRPLLQKFGEFVKYFLFMFKISIPHLQKYKSALLNAPFNSL